VPHRMMAWANATSWPAVTVISSMSNARPGVWEVKKRSHVFSYSAVPLDCKQHREIEHHDVRRVMGQNGGHVVPPNGSRPGFDERPDLPSFGSM
jgi:hypothetical protein